MQHNQEQHMAAKKSSTKKDVMSIIANTGYGLFAGIVEKSTPQPDGTLTVEVRECRHVARWYGKTGGITSLAAHGLCGPSAAQSRIGAPVKATLTGIRNVFECSPEARASIEAAKQE
jgi:hypothetical protein